MERLKQKEMNCLLELTSLLDTKEDTAVYLSYFMKEKKNENEIHCELWLNIKASHI